MEQNSVSITDAGAYILGQVNTLKAMHPSMDPVELLEFMRDNTITDPEAARLALYGPDVVSAPDPITNDNLEARISAAIGGNTESYTDRGRAVPGGPVELEERNPEPIKRLTHENLLGELSKVLRPDGA